MAESFAGVAGERLLRARLSKATLTNLSRVVENIVLDHDLRGVVMTGFQTGRNWNAELARYERLVLPSARRVAVFSDGNLAGLGEIHGFRRREQSGLRRDANCYTSRRSTTGCRTRTITSRASSDSPLLASPQRRWPTS